MRLSAQRCKTNDDLPILILGGGFAGLFTALHLRDSYDCPIILIDQSWSFVFKPLLYELLSSEVKLELIGGGASGIETAATLADLLPTWYAPFGKPEDIRIVILQRGAEILKESATDRLRETAQLALQQRTASVEVLLGSEVKAVHPAVVEFERNGQREQLAAATVIWTTGNATHPVIDALPIAPENRDEQHRLLVSAKRKD